MMNRVLPVLLLLLPAIADGQAFPLRSGGQIVPRSGEPITAAGNGVIWANSADSSALDYTNPAGTRFKLSLFPASLAYAKGTLLAHSGTAFGALAVGTDGQCLTAQSGQTLGLLWASCGGGGSSYYQTVQNYIAGNYADLTQRSKLSFDGNFSLSDSSSPSRTVVSLASSLTLTTPVIAGATASGSTAIDLSGSTGAFKTTTGAATLGNSSYSLNSAFTSALGFSPVAFAVANGGTSTAGNLTSGQQIRFTQPVTVTGVKFYHQGGAGSLSIKCTLWDSGSSDAGHATVAVNASGAYTASFTPVAVSSSNVYKTYTIGCWETSSAVYTYVSDDKIHPAGNGADTVVYLQSPWVEIIDDGVYHSGGDAIPTTSVGGTGQHYPMQVIFTAP